MSRANVEIARRGYEALTRGDLVALREILDPDVQWHGSEGPTEDSCHNREEALYFISQAMRRGGVGELVEVIDAGESVVLAIRPPAQGGSEKPQLRANLTTIRGGRVVRMVAYETPQAALAAAGHAHARG